MTQMARLRRPVGDGEPIALTWLTIKPQSLMKSKNELGPADYQLAQQDGLDETVRFLVGQGADPNAPAKDGSTPLCLAAASRYSSPATLHLLCEAGADLTAESGQGETALEALKSEQQPGSLYLIGRGLR